MIDQDNILKNEYSKTNTTNNAKTDPNQIIDVATPDQPYVVMVQKEKLVPWWFIMIFLLTFIMFIFISKLLISALISNKIKLLDSTLTSISSITPSPVLSVTIKAPESVDSIVYKIKKLNLTDSLIDIEVDIANSDFSVITKNIEELDKLLNFKP